MISTLDKYGRIIIPKRVREQTGITTETNLNIEGDGKRIIIEPVLEEAPVVEKEGILVFTGKVEKGMDKYLDEDRKQRINKLLSEHKK